MSEQSHGQYYAQEFGLEATSSVREQIQEALDAGEAQNWRLIGVSQRYSQILNLDLVPAVIEPSCRITGSNLRERLLHRFEEGFMGARSELP